MLITSICSFFISALILYSFQKVFIIYDKTDLINERSSHKVLATRTGGISVYITILSISIFYYLFEIDLFDYSIFIPLSIIFLIGAYDDFYNADFKIKFLFQIVVAKILIDQGYVISNFHGFLGLYEVPWLIAQLTTVFVYLIIVNSYNFIDGIDTLAITDFIKVVLILELIFSFDTDLTIFSSLIVSSLLPLFYFNLKSNQKIFLGDSGSLFLGSIVAVYIFNLLGSNQILKAPFDLNKTVLAILLLLYPLVDLFRVFVIRIYNGNSPFYPDQNHLHHFLHKRGVSAYINVIIIEIISIIPLIFAIIFF